MQQVRIWEITADRKLSDIPARYASLEQWIEDWLANDMSVLNPNLLVNGRQIHTREPLNNVAQVTYNSSWGFSETLEPHMGCLRCTRGSARGPQVTSAGAW